MFFKIILFSRLGLLIIFSVLLPFVFTMMKDVRPLSEMSGFSLFIYRIFLGDVRIGADSEYVVPISWIFIYSYLCFIIRGLPIERSLSCETSYIIHLQNRLNWWAAKCISSLLLTIFFFLIIYIEAFISSLIDKNACFSIMGENAIILAMPIAVGVHTVFLQLLLNLTINPMLSYIFSVGSLILSTYVCNRFLPGYYSQMLRLELDNFVYAKPGLVYLFILTLLYIFTGYFIIRKKDFIPNAGEQND